MIANNSKPATVSRESYENVSSKSLSQSSLNPIESIIPSSDTNTLKYITPSYEIPLAMDSTSKAGESKIRRSYMGIKAKFLLKSKY